MRATIDESNGSKVTIIASDSGYPKKFLALYLWGSRPAGALFAGLPASYAPAISMAQSMNIRTAGSRSRPGRQLSR